MQEAKRPGRRNHSEVCVLCGLNPSTTRDHLPPEGIFFKPVPPKSNLITVPACDSCNGGSSGTDEKFQAFMAMHVAHKTPSGTEYFKKQGRAVLLADQQRLAEIRSRMRKVEIVSPGGLILGNATAVLWDSDAFEALITRLIRGLYWHQTRTILPEGSTVEVQWPKSAPIEAIQIVRAHESEHAGLKQIGEQFAYCFMIDPNLTGHSMWVFQFHQSLWATGYTLPPGYVLTPEEMDPNPEE